MIQKHLQFSLAFAIILIAQLIMAAEPRTAALVLGHFQYAVKPLITISLMIYLTYYTQLKGRFSKRIFLGLAFGLIGDSLLMFEQKHETFFIGGLIAFLLGHIAYITAFYIDYKWQTKIQKKATLIAIAMLGLYCIGFYLVLSPTLGSLKIPVMIYAVVISLMTIMAVNRKGRVNSVSFNLIFFGALLFVLSDSILAYNRFVNPLLLSGVLIMLPYTVAQYLITMGAITRKLKKHSIIEIEREL
jgi:uncharacterized membrane protein YhhN